MPEPIQTLCPEKERPFPFPDPESTTEELRPLTRSDKPEKAVFLAITNSNTSSLTDALRFAFSQNTVSTSPAVALKPGPKHNQGLKDDGGVEDKLEDHQISRASSSGSSLDRVLNINQAVIQMNPTQIQLTDRPQSDLLMQRMHAKNREMGQKPFSFKRIIATPWRPMKEQYAEREAAWFGQHSNIPTETGSQNLKRSASDKSTPSRDMR